MKMPSKKISVSVGIALIFVLGFIFLRPFLFKAEPKSIAVISFENQTGDESYNFLQKDIPNLLITSLEQSRDLCVNTWERMYDLLKQRGREDVEIIDKDLGFELCRMDDIEAIVLGRYFKAGDMLVISLKVLDVKTERILKSAGSEGVGIASIMKEQIDELSREILHFIGISDAKIEMTQRPIADVTTTSMDAYDYYVQGVEDYEKRYFNDARKFLEKAVQLDSAFAVAHLYLAWTYGWLRNTKAMVNACKKAMTYSQRASDKERLYIEATYAKNIEKDPEKGFRIYKHMANKYPKEKQVHYFLADYYKSKKLYHEAIEEFNKALELDPDYGKAINSLAYTYAYSENYEKAIEYFKRYASVSPGDANPFDSMAEIYLKMGRLDEAIAKYREALEVKPDFGSDWRIAYIYALKEDYSEAMKWVNQFITMAPSPGRKAQGYIWKGFYHYWLGSLEQSLDELSRATDMAETIGNVPLLSLTDWIKGWIHLDRGEFGLSYEYFKKQFDVMVEYYPPYKLSFRANHIFCLGLVDLREGRTDSARSRLEEMKSLLPQIDQAPKERAAFYCDILYGEVLLAEDSTEFVFTIGEKASHWELPTMYSAKIISYNVPLLNDLSARAYRQKRDVNKAIAEYERLITFDPDSKARYLIHPKYHYRLAKLYEEKGWPDKALEQYNTFLEIWRDADEDLPELIDAKARLAQLTGQK